MTSFALKLIAALTMLIDHTGLILFPKLIVFRIIGRLAFPIYAYCIAEGFRCTRNRFRYFLRIFLLGLLCQIVYCVVTHDMYIGILLVFSMSIIIMALVDSVIVSVNGNKSPLASLTERLFHCKLTDKQDKTISIILCCTAVAAAFILCLFVQVDYGFFGIMLPVFTSIFKDRKKRLVMFSACLIALCIDLTDTLLVQYWSLAAIPLIALYNGEKGKHSLKYFFYVFYPLHLVVLYGIQFLIN
jgi:hypothetical protein